MYFVTSALSNTRSPEEHISWKTFESMGLPLGLLNKKSGVVLPKKNDPILSFEAKASRMDRISSLEDIDQLKAIN